MKRIYLALIVTLGVALQLQSCKKEQTEQKTDTAKVDVNKEALNKADSLLAIVDREWKVYTDLDSVKYKDLAGVYFQLKNIPTTNLKKLQSLEDTTKSFKTQKIHLRMPDFKVHFFAYDSLLMVHVRDVVDFAENTKGSENLAVLQQLNKSLLESVNDNLFATIQSHIDLAIVYYNDYLKAHPEVAKSDPRHGPLPEFGVIDRSKLKPVL